MKIYEVVVETWDYEWDDVETHYFHTEQESQDFISKITKYSIDGKPHMRVTQFEHDGLDDIKDEMTLEEFEEFMDIDIKDILKIANTLKK